MNDKNKQIGRKIKIARIIRNITQKELAKKIEVGPVTVSRIESGSKNITAVEMEKISKVFNCPISYFYEEEKEKIATYGTSEDARDLKDLASEDKEFVDELIERFKKKKK